MSQSGVDLAQLEGKVALVTGGAGQIGMALASALLGAGMEVMIADLDEDRLRQTSAALGDPERLRWACLDVTDPAAWARVIARLNSESGPPVLLFNNAGVAGTREHAAGELPPSDWQRTIDANFLGILHGVQAVLPTMMANGGGYIVNTASLGPFVASRRRGDYCASKAAVISLSETLRQELVKSGVGVSILCPGATGHKVGSAAGSDGRLDPAECVRRALALLRQGEFYLFTHPENRGPVEQRLDEIRGAFNALDAVLDVRRG